MKFFKDLQEKLQVHLDKYPKAILGGGALVFLSVGIFALSDTKEVEKRIDDKRQKPAFSGIVESVDPRDTWVSQLKIEMQNMQKAFEELSKKNDESNAERLKDLEEKLAQLEQQNQSLPELQSIVPQEQIPKQLEFKEDELPKPKPQTMTLKHISRVGGAKRPNEYVASGSFARAVLLTGVVAETSTKAATEAIPILLRLVDHSIFSKEFFNEELKEAILIGGCYGAISSERAHCRLESISLVKKDGSIIERAVEGWVYGEDGRAGMLGKVVDTSTKLAKAALLNGILGGVAGYFQNQANSGISLSPFVGNNARLDGGKALQSAGASGVGNALDKLAEYTIKKAEQMNPVIVVASGRVVDVVFKKGFHLNDQEEMGSVSGANTVKSIEQSGQKQYTTDEISEVVSDLQNQGM